MARIRPFRASRPPPAFAAAVASPPYDVVTTQEARELARGNPRSFFHVSRPEIDLPDGVDPYADEVHAQGARALARMRAEGTLVEDETPALYLYRLTREGRAQTGLVAALAVDDYDAGAIQKHERTRADKEDDRTRHVVALAAHDEPVFLACRPAPALAALAAEVERTAPLYDFVAPDGVGHTLWKVLDPSPWVAAFAPAPALYVADGHHRSAAASRARAHLRSRAAAWSGEEEANFFLGVIFPADQLRILPYNRVVRDTRGLRAAALLEAARASFRVVEDADPAPDRKGRIAMHAGGRWWGLEVRPGSSGSDPVGALDVSVLQSRFLAPVLGIADPRTDPRIDFVGGVRGTAELERRAGREGVAFSLFPVSMDELMAIADAGEMLPPKSTWFEPKLRSGLFLHPL